MKVNIKYFKSADIIFTDVRGFLDLQKSKKVVRKIVSHPDYNQNFQVLLDLREAQCQLSIADVYELASFMAWPNPELPTYKKVAVVAAGGEEFDHAGFFETCARNRFLNVKSFQDIEPAEAWLESEIFINNKGGP